MKRNGEKVLKKVENIFEYYCRISGFDIYNKFYRPTRLVAYRISEELRKLGVIDSCHLSEVDNLVKDHLNEIFDFESIFNKGKQQVNWIPDSDTISDFVKTILKASQMKLELVNPIQSARIYNILSTNIENIQKDYLDFLINAKDGLGLLKDYPISPRRVLVHDIIISLAKYEFFAQILKRDYPLKLISILLFGHKSPLKTFLVQENRPYPNKILSLYLPFTTDIITKFDKLDLTITFKQMKSLQEDIYEDIKSWIFSNPYNDDLYVNENPIRGFKPIKKGELFPEYDFVVAVWLMNAIHQNKKDLLFSELKGYRPSIFKKLLRNSDPLPENAWRTLMHGMLDIYEMDSSLYPEKTVIYRKCIKESVKYAKLRGFSFFNPKRPDYHKYLFNEEYVVAYNVIMELAMFHGIDPVDFTMLKDETFSKEYQVGKDKFARHEPFGYSLSPFSQVLTTFRQNVGIYKTLTKPQQRVAINLFKQLMLFEKHDAGGNLLDIDHTDIMRIYGEQNSWIYKRWGKGIWHDDPKFINTLNKLNHLRREIRQKSLDQYLKDNWKVAYNRFWVNNIASGKSRCDLYYLIYELEGLGDDNLVQDILSIDFGQLFGNLLSDHGYPVRL